MKPVLLQWGKNPGEIGKHVPMLFLDTETGKRVDYITPLSKADFEGVEIDWVARSNNFLVETAIDWGIDLGVAYGRFLELGLRLAQQLDGKHREITRPRFEVLYKVLETDLMAGVLAVRKQRRDAGLESLLEATDGMPVDEVASLSGYVAALKQRTIPDHEGKEGDYGVKQRLAGISHDQSLDDLFVQNAKLVQPELRAGYVQMVAVAEFPSNFPYNLREETEEIGKWLVDLGVENGRNYLKAVRGGLVHMGERLRDVYSDFKAAEKQVSTASSVEERLEAIGRTNAAKQKMAVVKHPRTFYNDLRTSLGQLNPEQQRIHLATLCAAQDAGLWLLPDDLMYMIEDIEKKEGSPAVKGVLESAVEALKNGHAAFFSAVERHGVWPSTRNIYITPSLTQ